MVIQFIVNSQRYIDTIYNLSTHVPACWCACIFNILCDMLFLAICVYIGIWSGRSVIIGVKGKWSCIKCFPVFSEILCF